LRLQTERFAKVPELNISNAWELGDSSVGVKYAGATTAGAHFKIESILRDLECLGVKAEPRAADVRPVLDIADRRTIGFALVKPIRVRMEAPARLHRGFRCIFVLFLLLRVFGLFELFLDVCKTLFRR
jgi:hypothetical protein